MRFNWLVATIVLLTVFWVQATTTGFASSEDDRYELTVQWPVSCQDLLSTQLSVYGVSVGDTEDRLLPVLAKKHFEKEWLPNIHNGIWQYTSDDVIYNVGSDGCVRGIIVLSSLILLPLRAAMMDRDVTQIKAYFGTDGELSGFLGYKRLEYARGFDMIWSEKNAPDRIGLVVPTIDLHEEYPDWSWELCSAVMNGEVSEELAARRSSWNVRFLKLIERGELSEARIAQHPDWSWAAIADRHIHLGMTKEEVRESWGEPKDINRTVSLQYTHEQWVYSGHYLYFENGLLATIQDR